MLAPAHSRTAERILANTDSVYRSIEGKAFTPHKFGKLWNFKLSEVDAWVCGVGALEQPEGLEGHCAGAIARDIYWSKDAARRAQAALDGASDANPSARALASWLANQVRRDRAGDLLAS